MKIHKPVYKRENTEKDKEGDELISQSKEHQQEYKEGSGCISHFDRSEGIFKSRPPELSQLVKLPKNYLLPIEEKEFRKYFIKGDEVQIANWVNKIKSKKPYFNIEKPKKKVSIKRRKKWYCWCCYKSEKYPSPRRRDTF